MATESEQRPPPSAWGLLPLLFVAVVWSALNFVTLFKDVAPLAREPLGLINTFAAIGGDTLFPSAVIGAFGVAIFWRRDPPRGAMFLAVIYGFVWVANFAAFEVVRGSVLRRDEAAAEANYKIAAASKTLQAQVIADQKSYEAELKGLGFPDFLKASLTQTDQRLQTVSSRLNDMHALTAKYRDLQDQRLDAFLAKVKALPAGDGTRDSFLADSAKSERQLRVDLAKKWSNEDRVTSECEAAIHILIQAEGRWSVRDGKYLFQDPATLVAWRAHMERARALQQQRIGQ